VTRPPKPIRNYLICKTFAKTPAGVGRTSPGDSKTRHFANLLHLHIQDLLANQAQGAEGNPSQNLSRPDFLSLIFQLAVFSKSTICERRKTQTTPLAARLYQPNFYSDEPLPETNKCPPFRNFTAHGTLGPGPTNARPATVTGYTF